MHEYYISLAKMTLYLALIITAPPVMIALLVGLTISILQATTQIQEMTLTFVPKLVAVVLALALGGPWMFAQLVNFAKYIMETFPKNIG